MFDLNETIDQWRRQIAARIQSPETLDELESHLRDEVNRQILSGLTEARAFEIAREMMGPLAALETEFKKLGHPLRNVLHRLKQFLLGAADPARPSLDDFAPSARQTLEIAPTEARRFHHDFVGTEHVLLGLTESPSGIVANVMRRLGLKSEAVRAEIEKLVGPGRQEESRAAIPFTPRAKRALRLAVAEARSLRHPTVNAEHIFLGLLLEGSGVAALVLNQLGVNATAARQEILRELDDGH